MKTCILSVEEFPIPQISIKIKKRIWLKKQLHSNKIQFHAGQWGSVSLKHPHHGGLGQTVSRCGGIIRVGIQRDKQNDAWTQSQSPDGDFERKS